MKRSFPEHHLFQLLKQFEHQYLPLDLFVHRYFHAHKQLGARDRRTIAHAVYMMYRWLALLDYLIEETPSWEKRYALFQRFQPDLYLYANHIPLHLRVSFPQELFALIVAERGEETAIRLCQVSNTEAPFTVRCNPIKTTREHLLDQWHAWDPLPTPHAPWGIHFKKRIPLTSFPEFKSGLCDIQDESSQCIAQRVLAQPGDWVLDYCAGAGGKTLAFAHRMERRGMIYLHDVRPASLEQARQRCLRAGISHTRILASGDPLLTTLPGKMDWVVVDAPCTGSGTWRRHPEQKWHFSRVLLDQYLEQQRTIFAAALPFVKPGGRILYATCSLLKAENEEQVAFFLHHHPLELEGDPFCSLPAYGEMDGGFAAVFKKKALDP